MKFNLLPLVLAFATYVAAQANNDSSLPFCDELDKIAGSKAVNTTTTPAGNATTPAGGNATSTGVNKAPTGNTTTKEGVKPDSSAVSMMSFHATTLLGVVGFFFLI
jgi:hypothetical protein